MKFNKMVDRCEDNYEFKNQRRKPIHLVAPLLAFHRINFSINRALLNSGIKQIIPQSYKVKGPDHNPTKSEYCR